MTSAIEPASLKPSTTSLLGQHCHAERAFFRQRWRPRQWAGRRDERHRQCQVERVFETWCIFHQLERSLFSCWVEARSLGKRGKAAFPVRFLRAVTKPQMKMLRFGFCGVIRRIALLKDDYMIFLWKWNCISEKKL